MNILVTGGAGYIGSHTCKDLYNNGIQPVVYDNLSTGHDWAVKWGPLVVGDIADYDLLVESIKKFNIKGVIHFAANAYVGESMKNPRKYFQNNIVNTLNLLNAMQDTGVKNIVFSSSCATYGIPDTVPIPENAFQKPASPYGESKLFVEKMLQWYGSAYDLHWIALRYFNAAGADPEGEIGEVHDPETHLIPLAIQTAMGNRDHLEIYGTDYNTPDGSAIRDYIHVSDLASAHVKALSYLSDGYNSIALNLGTGNGHSVYEVIEAVKKVSQREVKNKAVARRKGDPPILTAKVEHAEKVLGWQAQIPNIIDIVFHAWQWHLNNSKNRIS